MHWVIIGILLALASWIFALFMYFNINKVGDFYVIGQDKFLRLTQAQVLPFIIARIFLLKIKCKIVYDKGNYWINIKHGFFKYHSVKFFTSWADNSYTSYGEAMEVLKKYLLREINWGSTVKYKYKGDIIAEIRYHKGDR